MYSMPSGNIHGQVRKVRTWWTRRRSEVKCISKKNGGLGEEALVSHCMVRVHECSVVEGHWRGVSSCYILFFQYYLRASGSLVNV